MPTYLSRTTSRANSSLRAGSAIAAPPYLITTVWPWNSRMYGSASRRVAMSLIADPRPGRAEACSWRLLELWLRSSYMRTPAPSFAARRCERSRGPSRGVLRVEVDVLRREVGEEQLGLAAVAGKRQRVLDLIALNQRRELVE